MGVATGFTFPSDGDTSNATNDLVNNFNILKDSVNNVVADQITDATITTAKIATAGILAAKIKGLATGDASYQDTRSKFISGCWLSRNSDSELSVSAGSIQGPNGELRRITSALTNSPSVSADKWIDVYADFDASASTFVLEVIGNLSTPGSSTATATSSRLIGSIYGDSDSDITGARLINYRADRIVGVSYITGAGTSTMTQGITHGKTMASIDQSAPILTYLGIKTTAGNPVSVAEFIESPSVVDVLWPDNVATTVFTTTWISSGTFTSGDFHGYRWVIEGDYT